MGNFILFPSKSQLWQSQATQPELFPNVGGICPEFVQGKVFFAVESLSNVHTPVVPGTSVFHLIQRMRLSPPPWDWREVGEGCCLNRDFEPTTSWYWVQCLKLNHSAMPLPQWWVFLQPAVAKTFDSIHVTGELSKVISSIFSVLIIIIIWIFV